MGVLMAALSAWFSIPPCVLSLESASGRLRYLEEGREGERKKVKKRIRVEESREERKEG
jgi:hypothetical protein